MLDRSSARFRRPWAQWAIAAAAAIALADGSIVTLALPGLLHQLHTGVEGVAAILVVYCVALATAFPLSKALAARHGLHVVGLAGLLVFGVSSLACAAASSLLVLLVARAAQACGAAGALLFAFSVLRASPLQRGLPRLSLWRASAIFGTAAGPALGGALTQAFSWRAIFLVQAPVVLVAAFLGHGATPPDGALDPGHDSSDLLRGHRTAAIALAAVAAALSAVLFLLVLLLVTGGGLSPLHAAADLSVLPAAAIVAARVRTRAGARAAIGCLSLGAALLMLAFLPSPSLRWLIAPEILAGLGMGLTLPALAGELLPEHTAAQASRLLMIRFGGVALGLIVLAPLIASQLHKASERGRLEGATALLASPLSPTAKISLGSELARSIDAENPDQALAATVSDSRSSLSRPDRHALTSLERQGDAIVFDVAHDGLRDAFLIAGVLALIAAFLVRPPRRLEATAALTAAGLAVIGVYALTAQASRPALPAVAAACQATRPPQTAGILGLLQAGAITALDRVACRQHLSGAGLLLRIAAGRGP